MSYQAGVYYFDGRLITPTEARTILESVSCEDYGPPVSSQEPGLFLAQAGVFRPGIAVVTQMGRSQTRLMTFDGRIDNREDLALRLGDRLPSNASDSALALAAYEAWGGEGLANLVGDWSLAVWDAPMHRLLLASDYASCIAGALDRCLPVR